MIADITLSRFYFEPMSDHSGQQPFKPSGMIEFEITDVNDARKEAEKPSAIVALEKLLPGHWEEQRRPLTPSDRALTGKAIDWLMALPAIARPKALSEQYPRIANHLAELWSDLACAQLAMMRLLADERGGRKGFSLQIEQEMSRLATHVQALLENAPTEPAAL
ncbi:MAG: hypothetical protein ACHP83_03390 [Burkholderiales bacterium]